MRYPTYWHVRNYGLDDDKHLSGPARLKADPSKDGSYTMKSGEEMNFCFRVLIHTGDAATGQVGTEISRLPNYQSPLKRAPLSTWMTLIASAGDVHFGDTKEGGIIQCVSIRQ